MKKHRRGFTLIEVTLFLAVTMILFVGIIGGVQSSIFQQRYNDSVQNFAEFLRSVYAQVSNVQNESLGRSELAIYGKVVTFDVDESSADKPNVIKTYNLVGNIEKVQKDGSVIPDGIDCTDNYTVMGKLACRGVSIFVGEETTPGVVNYRPVGFVENYLTRWNSRVQTMYEYGAFGSTGYANTRAIMIVTHSPDSGNVFTYVLQDPEGENVAGKGDALDYILGQIKSCENGCTKMGGWFNPFSNGSASYLSTTYFEQQDIDFCVNPYGADRDLRSTLRRDIRIAGGTHNASGVEVLSEEKPTADQSELDTWKNFPQNRCMY